MEASCVYLATGDYPIHSDPDFKAPHELDYFFGNGLEIARSLWNRCSLIVHLDIEYVNFDFPAEPYLNPLRTFSVQQPVERAVEKILLQYGIAPLHLVSGRGHHFVWRIRRDSQVFNKLVHLGHLPVHMKDFYSKSALPGSEKIDRNLGSAFAGLGLVMEYIASRIQSEADQQSEIPVEITEVAPGPQKRGREIVSIDISEYGDPLNTRMIRVPFAVYLKPLKKEDILPEQIEPEIPVLFTIPLHEMDLSTALMVMRSADETIELAKRASVQIPDQTNLMENLIAQYVESELAEFHNFYYSQEHEPAEIWPQTYDLTPLDEFPYCVRKILEFPNDLLQKPAGIRQLVRTLLSFGWHPRHNAGLIRSKYERDFGWGKEWYVNDAATRADFYVRIFSALVAIGQDDLIDFNCLSTKEKGFCFQTDESCDLDDFRLSLIERRKYERLADRPFNRLFLQNKHL
jgi:hypothetical protein